MGKKIDIDILSITESHGVFTVQFTYSGDPGDVDIEDGERLSIEVPSHAPPPAPKKDE